MDKSLCKICRKLIPKKHFARYQLSHSEEKKFSCYQCAKKFKTKDKLNCHLKTHRKPEDIQCKHCSHVLHSSSALAKHIKTYHEKISFSCPYCDKQFTRDAYCQKHIETCKSSIPCVCPVCMKSCKNARSLEIYQLNRLWENVTTVDTFFAKREPTDAECESAAQVCEEWCLE